MKNNHQQKSSETLENSSSEKVTGGYDYMENGKVWILGLTEYEKIYLKRKYPYRYNNSTFGIKLEANYMTKANAVQILHDLQKGGFRNTWNS